MKHNIITTFFDIGYQIRQFLQDSFIYLSFLFYGFSNITFDEVHQHKYNTTQNKMNVDLCWDLDPLYQVVRDAYIEGKNRRKLLTEKCHALHLYSMFCVLVIGMILKGNVNWSLGIILGFCLFFLILTILILIAFYGKNCWACVDINEIAIKKQGETLKKHLIIKYYDATSENDRIINYLVDIVAVARFYFTIAVLLLTLAIFVYLYNLVLTK
jgi:hypothetical protein